VWTVEFSCILILVMPRAIFCWLSWPITLVMQFGGELPGIVMVALRNLHLE
jgi:hypothetical protein